MLEREITLRFLAEPAMVNFGGKMHGGSVMKWIDQAGYTCAVGWSGQYCVTVYVGGIRFYKPIFIGHLVEVRAKIIYTGNTSMHVAVDVFSRDPKHNDMVKNTHCIIVFVAVDEHGTAIAVPAWQPQTDEDQSLQRYATRLMDLRHAIDDEMRDHL